MNGNYFENVKEAKTFLSEKVVTLPRAMIVLSGGLTEFPAKVEDPLTILAEEIPHFPKPRAEGHSGKIVFGHIGELPVVVFQGRFHYYEGHKMEDIVFPVFAMHALGAKTLVVTNAVGGINTSFKLGEIMLITDHMNCMGTSPLIGLSILKPKNQFPDMTDAYSKRLQNIARAAAAEAGVEIREGVYIAVHGPSYETPMEVKVFRNWGADAVGMSIVPEIIAANYLKMETLGFSCITNPAADIHPGGMNHNEVLAAMKDTEGRLVKLLLAVVSKLK